MFTAYCYAALSCNVEELVNGAPVIRLGQLDTFAKAIYNNCFEKVCSKPVQKTEVKRRRNSATVKDLRL